jgi:hypothetical protein
MTDWADEVALKLQEYARKSANSWQDMTSENSIAAALRSAERRGRVAGLRQASSAAINHGWFMDIEWWMNTPKKDISRHAAEECVMAIDALANRIEKSE